MSSFREEIERHSRNQTQYKFRAYMSSALTGLPNDCPIHVKPKSCGLTDLLESIYMDVCHPEQVFLYLPHLWSNPAEPGSHSDLMTAEDVHVLDRLRIAESDFMIACADHPAFGVGQEFEIAQAMGVPVLLFYEEHLRISRMLLGGAGYFMPDGSASPGNTNAIVYSDARDLTSRLRLSVRVLCSTMKKTPVDDSTIGGIAAVIREQMRERRPEDLAAAIGVPTAFVNYLLSDRESLTRILNRHELPHFATVDVTKYVNPGLWILIKLCRALNISWETLLGQIPTLKSTAAVQKSTRDKVKDAFIAVMTEKDRRADRVWDVLNRGQDDRLKLAARTEELKQYVEEIWNRSSE